MNNGIRADIEVASGRMPADIILRNGHILDVFTGDICVRDIAIRAGVIVATGAPGSYQGREEVDLLRRIVVPGLIDAHVHIESSLLGPVGFAGITLPKGTTTVIADPHEIANVCGMDGIRWLLNASEKIPQSVFVMLPSSVPATEFEDAGAILEADDLAELIEHPRVLGLGEAMDFPAVLAAQDGIVKKIQMALNAGKSIDGHSPSMTGKDLAAYAVAGISTDHECSTIDEMRERLSLGMRVLIREGTAARDLVALIGGVDARNAQRCAFCTDDKLPEDIIKEGHIDHNVRFAIQCGLDPIDAVRMATINAADAYGLQDRGAIAPRRRADFIVLSGTLNDFQVQEVYRGGKKVAEDGRMCEEIPASDNALVRDTIRIAALEKKDFYLHVSSEHARVISVEPGSLVTKCEILKISKDSESRFTPSLEQDLLKLVVVERHHGTGRIGLGIVKGYGLSGGAVASSIAHDSHNLIAIGDDDDAILSALRVLVGNGGGLSVAAAGGEIIGNLPLPLGGLMTDQAGIATAKQLQELSKSAHQKLGVYKEIDPFMPLSFLALPVIPEIKLTARGLFDVNAFKFVSVDV